MEHMDGTPLPETSPAPEPIRKRKWNKPLLIIGAIIIGIALIGGGCKIMADRMSGVLEEMVGYSGNSDNDYVDYSGVDKDHIAVITVDGVITSTTSGGVLSESTGYDHQFTLDSIDQAISNNTNKGLLLYINSPGGGVYESDELYLKIREYQKTTGRPVYVYMGSMAASGGYYIASSADKIIANRNCWTGSIGVTMGTYYDISGLLEKYGVKTVTITAGKNKAMGSYTDPLTPEQLKILHSLVDEAYDQFVSIVAEGRNMTIPQVEKLADGRVYTAKQAQKLGLIDGIETFDQAVETFKSEQHLQNCQIVYVNPPTTGFLEQLLGEVKNIKKSSSDISMVMELMDENGQMPIAYLSDIVK